MTHLLIRADANTTIGTGHIMRCLALAQAWLADGGQVTYLVHESLPATMIQRLQVENCTVITHTHPIGSQADAEHTITQAQQQDATLILDGYQFGAAYQQIIAQHEHPTLLLDDYGHADFYHVDFVLNQNIHAEPHLYTNRAPHTELLLGLEYALIRREFWPFREAEPEIALRANKILVTMGGSDPDNITGKVLSAIAELDIASDLDLRVIVGGSNPHKEALEQLIADKQLRATLLYNISDMPQQMQWADLAISAGGSTVWELCLMGVPTVTIITADNQREIAINLAKRHISINLGWHKQLLTTDLMQSLDGLMNNIEERQRMSHSGRALVDGKGTNRVTSELINTKM